MPELAEVLYFSRRWRPGLGEKIVRVHLHSAKRVFRGTATHKLQKKLPGATMISCETHGKQMLFRFGRKGWLGIHLGMTGKLLTESPEHSPGKHDHLVLYTRRRALVFQDPRLFGRVRFTCSSQSPPWWSTLPPGILSRDFSLCRLAAVCRRRGHTPLKALLLLQEFFPGIGNWMADEILWQARLDPRTRAGAGIEACLPENFIRHPVADAGKKFLQQKQGLQGGVTTPAAHSRKAAEGEVPGQNPRGKGAPPRGRLRRAGEANPTEESRILKHQSSSAGVEDQVVVFPGRMLRTFRQQFSRHAEVNSQPTLSAETEKHLFAVRLA